MARVKLTKAVIGHLRAPDPSGKQVLHLDTEIQGFGVLCSGSTPAKSFIAQKRLASGQLRRVTIGSCAVFTLDEARAQARELLVGMARGQDPVAERQRKRVSTLAAVLESYLATRKDLRPKTIKIYRDAAEHYLRAWLEKPMATISPEMVEATHTALGRSAGEATANSTFRVFRALYNHAMDRDDTLPLNPVRRLKKGWFPNVVRGTFLRAEQLPAFYAAVDSLPSRIASAYLKLLLFTGLRRNEASALTWAEVDLGARLIRLPATRTKAGRKLDLPMTSFVRDLLVAHRAIGTDGPFVFSGNSKSGHLEEPKFHLGLVAKQTGIAISAHDLRRTYVTTAESCDISPIALKALINHALGNDVTSGYIQITTERLREPAQKVCDRLMTLCGVDAADHNLAYARLVD